MRRSHGIVWSSCFALAAGFAASGGLAGSAHAGPAPEGGELTIGRATRLLVFAPHPDDEVIGAGGLIQRVHAAGGVVQVVYLTDGEAYREGVRAEEGRARPTALDYRKYGQIRRKEASAALGALGLPADAALFLGFPQGLDQLLAAHWSNQRAPYRSPYTQLEHPATPDPHHPGARFRGQDLRDELEGLIAGFRPSIVLVTRKEDQHVDHCAAWFFVANAVEAAHGADPQVDPEVFTYIVHYYAWPFKDDRDALAPPAGLSGGSPGWVRIPLLRKEVVTKRTALHRYKSQMKTMSWFLEAFARTSEVFGHPPKAETKLPLSSDPCAAFADLKAHP